MPCQRQLACELDYGHCEQWETHMLAFLERQHCWSPLPVEVVSPPLLGFSLLLTCHNWQMYWRVYRGLLPALEHSSYMVTLWPVPLPSWACPVTHLVALYYSLYLYLCGNFCSYLHSSSQFPHVWLASWPIVSWTVCSGTLLQNLEKSIQVLEHLTVNSYDFWRILKNKNK